MVDGLDGRTSDEATTSPTRKAALADRLTATNAKRRLMNRL
jgi:hypothetical protein